MFRSLALLTLLLPAAPAQDFGATPRLRALPAGLPHPGAAAARSEPSAAKDEVTVASGPVEFWLPGGEIAVFALDLEAGTVEATLPSLGLTEDAAAAVAEVPAWLQPHLSVTLSHLEAERLDVVAAALTEAVGEDWLDEFAFTVAATSPEELAYPSRYLLLDVLADNAQAIYEADPLVPFAELTEDGEHTSVRYTWDDGSGPQTWDLPWEHYYWYVVNSKLDMELPFFMDPERYSLSSPPAGVHWRRWMLVSATEEGTWDYRTHWLQAQPHATADEDLWSVPALGWLDGGWDVDPLVVVADADGTPMMVEQDYGAGTILSTTLDLEAAWLAGSTEIAENATFYAQRRDTLDPGEATLILVDDEEGGAEGGLTFQAILEAEGLPVTRADIAANPGFDGVTKVILAAASSERWLEALSALAPDLEAFAAGGGTILHVADMTVCAEGGCDFPGGLTGTGDVTLPDHFVGHPVLAESLAGIASLWDGVQQPGLAGERGLDEVTNALDAVGWFVTQNMFDNVSEYSATHSDYDGERAVWPQRILHEHFGNCGECQDMITGAGRAALIPVVNAWSMEDHVWNEFYFQDAWHPWQVDWSDGPTRIDYGGVAYDVQYGGGKDVSAIMAFHENGRVDDEHIALYSDTITAEVTVTDAEGQPVAGAMVLVAVENFYYGQYLDQAAWRHTDQQGQVSLTLGDSRNFWVLAAADLGEDEAWAPYSIPDIQSGSYPNMFLKSQAGDPTITAEDAVAGAHFDVPITLDGRVGRPLASQQEASGKATVEVSVDLALDATLLDVPARHTFLGWYAGLGYAYGGGLVQPLDAPGTVDAYVVDADNLALFEAGQPFEAAVLDEGVGGAGAQWDFGEWNAKETDWYLVLSNLGSPRHTHHGTITVAASRVPFTPEPEGGCGCAAGPRAPRAWALGLLALSGLTVRRRRR
ncbi:MAG: Ig-like domain-containing protein [Pseudomonadota bacterium]